MDKTLLIKHHKGAPGLRLFGLGPYFKPTNSLNKLQKFFNKETFWANNRSQHNLQIMLKNSDVVITIWLRNEIIGFGRATTDSVFRAVLWDVVIAQEYQGLGLGKKLIDSLINHPLIINSEKIYLMTTNQCDFYNNLGFQNVVNQELLLLNK